MRKITTLAATAGIFLTAGVFTAPTASAHSGHGTIRVCVSGLDGRDADVEVNRSGPGGAHYREADPCHTFRGLRTGTYLIDIDLPRGFRTDDDDRWIRLSSHEFDTVWFDADRKKRYDRDDDHDWDGDHDWRHNDDWDRDCGGNNEPDCFVTPTTTTVNGQTVYDCPDDYDLRTFRNGNAICRYDGDD
jgi:hypothetical protein